MNNFQLLQNSLPLEEERPRHLACEEWFRGILGNANLFK